jgi:hypothetical protein
MGTRAASLLLLIAILTILGEGSSWAQQQQQQQGPAKPMTTVLIIVEGAPPALRGGIGVQLPSPWTQADAAAVATAAKKRQMSRSLRALENPSTKEQYTTKLALLAADVGVRAALTVVVITKRNDRKGHVVLVTDTGDELVDTYVALGEPADDAPTIAKAFSDKLDALAHPASAKAEPTTAAAPGASPEAPKSDAAPSEGTPAKDAPATAPPTTPPGTEAPPLLVGTLAFELAARSLDFRGVGFRSTPEPFDSGLVPTPALAVDFFPAARTGTSVLRDLGVTGDFRYGFASGDSWTRFDIGLKYRIVLRRDWNAPMIAPSVTYGQESYSYGSPSEKLPNVSYGGIRPRVDVRVPVWKIAVHGGGGFLFVLARGDLATKFSDPSVLGWEADLGVSFPLNSLLEVRAGFGYRRYIYYFSPQPSDTNFAYGAHDQMFRPDIGVIAHL